MLLVTHMAGMEKQIIFSHQTQADNLRTVENPEGKQAVSKPTADNQRHIADFMHAGGVLWEQSLLRRKQAAHKGQADLPAMRMAA